MTIRISETKTCMMVNSVVIEPFAAAVLNLLGHRRARMLRFRGAAGEIRTPTVLPPPAPQAGASTSSATAATDRANSTRRCIQPDRGQYQARAQLSTRLHRVSPRSLKRFRRPRRDTLSWLHIASTLPPQAWNAWVTSSSGMSTDLRMVLLRSIKA